MGRDQEAGTIADLLDSIGHRSAVVVVEGQPGIGKSAIWDHAVNKAAADGWLVMAARPAEAEAQAGWSALADLLDDVDDSVLAALPAAQRQALDAALLRAEPTAATAAEPRATWVALRSVVVELAQSGRVLVAIDDAQWLDPASAGAIGFLARRLPPFNVCVLAATRPSPVLDVDRGDAVSRIELGALSLAAIYQMIRGQLGVALGRMVLERIHETAGGNPLFALELARLHVKSGHGEVAGTPLALPRTLHELVASRVTASSRTARDTLVAIAAASRPSVGLLADARLDAGLTEAETKQLVRVDGTRVAFTHPLLGSAAYGAAPSDLRRAVHERLAAVTDVEESARHRALAAPGPDGDVAAALDDAAARAAKRGAPATAAELAELALRLTPEGDARWGRHLAVGEQLFRAGDTERAGGHLETTYEQATEPQLRARAAIALAELEWETGFGPRAKALAEEAVNLVGDDAELRARAMVTLARVLPVDSVADAAERAREAVALIESQPSPDPALLASALSSSAASDFSCGLGLDRSRFERAIELESLTVAPRVADRAFAEYAAVLKYADDFDAAREALREVRRMAEEEGDESSLPYAIAHVPQLELWTGHWDRAEEAAREHLAMAERTGEHSQRAQAESNLAQIAAHRGDLGEVRRLALPLVAVGVAEHDQYLEQAGTSVLGFAALVVGDYTAAVEYMDRAVELADAMGTRDPGGTRRWADHIEALLAVGQRDRAAALLDVWQERARRLDRISGRGSAARCRAILAGIDGDHAAATAAIAESLAQYDRLDIPFDRARTLLAAGRLHRRAKEKRAARDALTQARELFVKLGAHSLAEQAAADLDRVGLRPAAPLDLTATELRVTELAAEGLTTRQIAESLFMSPKTVESNLTRIYRKLNLRSRTDLANWVARRTTAD